MSDLKRQEACNIQGFYLRVLSGGAKLTSIFIIMHSLPIAQTAKSDIWELRKSLYLFHQNQKISNKNSPERLRWSIPIKGVNKILLTNYSVNASSRLEVNGARNQKVLLMEIIFFFAMKQIIKHFVNTVELEHKSIGTRKYMSLLIDPIFIPAF